MHPAKTPPGMVSGAALGAVRKDIARNQTRAGVGMRMVGDPTGQIVSVATNAFATSKRWNFGLRGWRVAETRRDATYLYCSIFPSTINGVVASNWNTEITPNLTGTWYAKVDVTISGGKVSSTSYSVSTSAPTAPGVLAGTPPTSFSILLAIIHDATIYQIRQGAPLTVTPVEVYRAAKVTTTPGEYPMDIYYTWEVT